MSQSFARSPLMSRREMLRHAGFGFGAWALLDLLGRDGRLAAERLGLLTTHSSPSALISRPGRST
jgi:hypothetical protein